jgi:hypothetical protein
LSFTVRQLESRGCERRGCTGADRRAPCVEVAPGGEVVGGRVEVAPGASRRRSGYERGGHNEGARTERRDGGARAEGDAGGAVTAAWWRDGDQGALPKSFFQ